MTCNICKFVFNDLETLPKILPCLGLSCLKCLQTFPRIQNESLVNCINCSRPHFIANINDLPTSNITLDLVTNADKKTELKEFQERLKFYLNSEHYEIYKHYDDVICDIDIKAETLIQFIHETTFLLQHKVRDHQRKTLSLYMDGPIRDDELDEETRKMLDVKDKLFKLAENKVKNFAELQLIIQQANQFQNYMHELEKNVFYFSESSKRIETSLLGLNLNSLFDQNFSKISNLNEIFKNLSDSKKVQLNLKFDDMALRKEVFALNDKYIVFYFTCKRTIIIESFDIHGKFIKTIEPFSALSSFPVSSFFENHFVLSFTSSSTHSIHLFDSDLNEIRSMVKKTYIESLYLNATHLLVTYDRNRDCVEMYDYEFKFLNSFGQNTNAGSVFYMERCLGSNDKNSRLGTKSNPRIFGLTEKHLYMSNFNKVSILDRVNGNEVKRLELRGFRPYFMMDMQKNIIEVNILEKRIGIYTSDLVFLSESIYSDEYEYVHVTPNNNLMFLDIEKKNLALI